MVKSALIFGLLGIAALPVGAATIITRTGAATSSLSGVTSIAVSWTQAAGNTYSAAAATVTVHSTNGSAATATAYLTNAIGVGATVTNQLATAPVSVSAATATTVAIGFPSVTLPPGTYYLVLSNFSANFAWDFVGGGATEAVGTGVTSNIDLVDTATPTPAFPPNAPTFVPASAGGSSRVFLFSATGTFGVAPPPPPTGVPTLGTWAMLGTALLLGASGLLFLKRSQA